MTNWEFLIQREGDRSWRKIKTGNLQLTEGKYRIVANTDLLDTKIQTRIVYQASGETKPQRRSRSYHQTSNARGLVVIIPSIHLQVGIWQFSCSSGATTTQPSGERVLKLRVLPLNSPPFASNEQGSMASQLPTARELCTQTTFSTGRFVNTDTQPDPSTVTPDRFSQSSEIEDPPQPTEPLVPLSMESGASWADGLDRLLAQIERESLKSTFQPPAVREILPGIIQLSTIAEPPSQLISLNRSTFSGLIPGNRLTVHGTCNLQMLNANLIQTVKIETISIGLRHPHTSETIVSIEQPLPSQLESFEFKGQLELPLEPKISLLLGEVNLYDKHHIQLASSGFTVTLNLNPLYESELSLLQLFEQDSYEPAATLAQLTQELKIEAATIGVHSSPSRPNRFPIPSPIQPPTAPQYPTVPLAYRREAVLDRHPDIVPVRLSTSSHLHNLEIAATTEPHPAEIADDLEIDFAPTIDRATDARYYPNLEVVIDD
jgi:hypothetical protein